MKRILLILGLSVGVLSGCETGRTYAPVTEVSPIEPIPKVGQHKVAQEETLYAIAWRYGLDYRYLAARNNIKPPYAIVPGQIIVLTGKPVVTPMVTPSQPQAPIVQTETVSKPPLLQLDNPAPEPSYSTSTWLWPASGKVITAFSSVNKGINIGGQLGEPIKAAASGKVVYAGAGLRGYGNLIILKHNSLYLSAYAYNRKLLVKEGDWVKKGQKIAEMGNSNSNKPMLHFEIRKAGKPLNPITLYP